MPPISGSFLLDAEYDVTYSNSSSSNSSSSSRDEQWTKTARDSGREHEKKGGRQTSHRSDRERDKDTQTHRHTERCMQRGRRLEGRKWITFPTVGLAVDDDEDDAGDVANRPRIANDDMAAAAVVRCLRLMTMLRGDTTQARRGCLDNPRIHVVYTPASS